MDTEYWMSNMPIKLRQLPLIHLAIPGSHDSMTSTITYRCMLAPDAEPFLQQLRFLGPFLRYIMARWSKTQALNLLQQLKAGIRYFDFRVATKVGDVNPYFVHGLYATEVVDALHELNQFLNTHPKEVVIVDFQHFYAFNPKDHENFINSITSIFDDKLIPYCEDMENLSLSQLDISKHQLFVIYRSEQAHLHRSFLWPSNSFPTPWPQTLSLTDLVVKLNQGLVKRPSDYGYVSQFVLTPTTWFVGKHLFSTLKGKCAVPIQKMKLDWIQKQRNGPRGVNIIICDFIDLDNCDFIQEVINVNFKSIPAMHEDSLTPVGDDKQ